MLLLMLLLLLQHDTIALRLDTLSIDFFAVAVRAFPIGLW